MMRALLFFLLTSAFLSLPGQVEAQSGALREGLVKSQAIQPLPPGFSIGVILYDDSDLNLEIKKKMERALMASGRLVVEDASALDFLIDTEVVFVEVQGIVPYLGTAGTDQATGGASVTINVWSSRQNSLLGGEGESAAGRAETSFHINAQLRDAETGRVLWQGDAYGHMPVGEPRDVMASMVEKLAERLGETTSPQRFTTY